MDQVTIELPPGAKSLLERLAAERGDTIEAVARDLLAHFVADESAPSHLSDDQWAEIDRRLAHPRGIATDVEAEAFFAEMARD
jgi:predicted transcriptional regulator